MPKNYNPPNYSPLTAADFVRRLSLNRQLDASQTFIVTLIPAWLRWMQQALPQGFYTSCQPSGFQLGKLTILCKNSTSASQIRHLQQSLLDFLQQQGFVEIEQIMVRIQHSPHQFCEKPPQAEYDQQPTSFVKASEGSLKAIDNCQKRVKNEHLARALLKLENTLRNR